MVSLSMVKAIHRCLWLFCTLLCLLAWESNCHSQNPKPHPWLANAPGEFVRLVDRGNVQIEIDDERVRRANKAALTVFQFAVKYDSKIRFDWLKRGGSQWQARVIATMEQPQVRLDHKIFFPTSFNPSQPWETRLLKHEFDHVAISTDPRLIKIIKRVLQRRRNSIESWDQETMPSDSDIRQRIQQIMELEIKQFEQMIQMQYDLLDQESMQGLRDINDRHKFFVDLYTIEGLERYRFPFLDSVKSFVKDKLSTSSSVREVEEHYLYLRP